MMEDDYFLHDLELLDEIQEVEEAENLPPMRRVKYYKNRANPLELLDDEEFRTKYRFSKRTAIYVIDILKCNLEHDLRGGAVPLYLQVLTAIRTWARGEFQDDAGDLSGISQPQVSIICKQVGLALAAKRAEYIKMPQTEDQQNKVIAEFYAICGFRQIIGAIDCTHIRIPKQSGDVGQYYINRKGYSSINVQVVCDAQLRIMDIVARWRGSTHDSRIFNECSLKTRFENREFKGRLLGDSGYACTPYLFTPILNPSSPKQEAYNEAHMKTRNTVERCFGVWKQRFRCLLHGFTTKLHNTKVAIVALAVLHNISLTHDSVTLAESSIMQVADSETENVHAENQIRGNAARAAFIEVNF